MAAARDPRAVSARIEELLDELTSAEDARVRDRAEELVRLLMELYGTGLAHIVEMLSTEHTADDPDGRLVDRLVADELVASLLVLHDLHPRGTAERVHEALETVRPYLGSHAGGVAFLGLDDGGVAHLRLEGTCDGCPSSTATVKLAIERAIEESAPEVTAVEVEGMTDQAAESPGDPQVIPVGALYRECPVPETEAAAAEEGEPTRGRT